LSDTAHRARNAARQVEAQQHAAAVPVSRDGNKKRAIGSPRRDPLSRVPFMWLDATGGLGPGRSNGLPMPV